MKLRILIVMTLFLVAACGGDGTEEPELPTLAVLPTQEAADIEPTVAPTNTIEVVPTATDVPPTATEVIDDEDETATIDAPPAEKEPNVPLAATLIGTRIAGSGGNAEPDDEETVDLAPVVIAAAPTLIRTLAPEELPVFSTLTPGPNPPPDADSEIMADLVITEPQFQAEIDLFIQNSAVIESAIVDFQPGSIHITMTALVGTENVTGEVVLGVELSIEQSSNNRVIQITIDEIVIDGTSIDLEAENIPPSSEAFVIVATTELFTTALQSIDSLFTLRVGSSNDLEILRVTDDTMEAALLVPRR